MPISTLFTCQVGVIGNLVHSSPNIKKEVLNAGALQPVIGLLSSCCTESQREAALLLGQFASADSDCKVLACSSFIFSWLVSNSFLMS
jgi:hypothetical protein